MNLVKPKKKFPNVRCEYCGLVFSTKPVRLKYKKKDWSRCNNRCKLKELFAKKDQLK